MFKLLALCLAMTASSAFAIRLPVGVARPIEKLGTKTFGKSEYDWEGIVKLSNCSGALVKFEGASDDKKAIVMTNGHCADLPGGRFLQPGEVLVNKAVTRRIGLFDKNMNLQRGLNATKFLYATMTDTDVALYELDRTYRDIKDHLGVEPLTLAKIRPHAGVEMQIVSGYWERGWDCQVETFIHRLKEAGYTWIDSLRYNESCDTTHGTSGSPIIERNTRTVIGINNTGSDDGEECTMNNPCEVNEQGEVSAHQGLSYGQQTYTLYSCLNENHDLDLKHPGCLLPKPSK